MKTICPICVMLMICFVLLLMMGGCVEKEVKKASVTKVDGFTMDCPYCGRTILFNGIEIEEQPK